MQSRIIQLMIAGLLLATAPAIASVRSLGFSLEATSAPGTAPDDVSVSVVDEATGQPLADVTVVFADSLTDSSTAQRNLTGVDGQTLFKQGLSKPRTLTVSKDGYISTSIVGLQSPRVTVHLKTMARTAPEQVLANGSMTGWTNQSGQVNLGLVFRSLSTYDLLDFEVNSLISPLKDTINVMGPREIPSNIVIPNQSFMFITVNKPNYRLPLIKGSTVHLAGVQGSVSTGDIMGLAQGGGMNIEFLNKVKFNRAGISTELRADNDFKAVINAGYALKPSHRVTPSTPSFKANILVTSVVDMEGDRMQLLPTDIKAAASLQAPAPKTVSVMGADRGVGRMHDILTIAIAEKGKQLSGIITENAGADVRPGEFLKADLLADVPSVPETVKLTSTSKGVSAAVFETAHAPLWYVYMLPSAGQTTIPTRGVPGMNQAVSYSFMQLDFGTSFNERAVDGQSIMKRLERFARSSVKVVKPKRRRLASR